MKSPRSQQEPKLVRKEQRTCSDCKSTEIHTNDISGFYECTECGNVFENIIDLSAEWRFYGNDDTKNFNPTRTGCPVDPYLPQFSMSTTMVGSSKYKNAIKLHKWIRFPYEERSMFNIFEYMKLKTQHSGLFGAILEDAKYYFWSLQKKDEELKKRDESFLLRGGIREGFIAACVYQACKDRGIGKSTSEISKIFDITEEELTIGYKKLVEISNKKKIRIDIKIHTPLQYIENYGPKLRLSGHPMKIARVVALRAEQKNLINSHQPLSIAAGILYTIATLYKLPIKPRDIKEITGKSEVTIINLNKYLMEHINILLPKSEKVKLNLI
jgi:transcription initiation factor TFIIB